MDMINEIKFLILERKFLKAFFKAQKALRKEWRKGKKMNISYYYRLQDLKIEALKNFLKQILPWEK